MINLRKSRITREELLADMIFFAVSALVSFILVFLFDIHRSFYPGHQLEFIFTSVQPYVLFILFGAVVGFWVIKIFLFGVHEEEKNKKIKQV